MVLDHAVTRGYTKVTYLILAALLVVGGYYQAEHHRKKFGVVPWNLPSWVWGVLWGLGLLPGAILWVIAVRMTKPATVSAEVPAQPMGGQRAVATTAAAAQLGRGAGLSGASGQEQPGATAPEPPTAAPAPALPPAGWYPDSSGSGHRYWDGAAWTTHTHDGAT